MNDSRSPWIKSWLLAAVPVLVVLNLSFGAPLLCRLHYAAQTGETAGGERLAYHYERETTYGGQAAGRPQSICCAGHPGSNQLLVSATFELAGLDHGSPPARKTITAVSPAPEASPLIVYLPPLDKPPASGLAS